ncbi:MAG: 5'-methylthioadenosine/S-adenosylhomocysteine nucleosidase [Thermomicrobiales bacterium]|nr:5'-methylthioadenosine/S-adenosylhomocysteine nucleosidase [Thermomicrobiales bacterium]
MTAHEPAPIGVVVAMASELQHLLDHVTPVRQEQHGPWLDRFELAGDVPIITLRCGIGMVNAAAGTEHLVATFAPRAVINFGCVGAHRRDILPGDVVIGNGAVNHGAMHILATGDTYFPGMEYQFQGEEVALTELVCDPALLAETIAAAVGWEPDPWPKGLNLPDDFVERAPQVHVGRVGSADIWTQHHGRIDELHAQHRTLCEDMEAAAIAHVCARHGVPFMTVKDVSNNEFHKVSDLVDQGEVLPAAEVGRRSADLVLRLLARLGA